MVRLFATWHVNHKSEKHAKKRIDYHNSEYIKYEEKFSKLKIISSVYIEVQYEPLVVLEQHI